MGTLRAHLDQAVSPNLSLFAVAWPMCIAILRPPHFGSTSTRQAVSIDVYEDGFASAVVIFAKKSSASFLVAELTLLRLLLRRRTVLVAGNSLSPVM